MALLYVAAANDEDANVGGVVALTFTDSNAKQLPKAVSCMVLTPEPISIDFRLWHRLNAGNYKIGNVEAIAEGF